MQCSYCGKENKSDSKYCIYCGSPLSPALVDASEKQSPLIEEISRLRRQMWRINKRLDELESAARIGEPPAVTEPPVSIPVDKPETAAVPPETPTTSRPAPKLEAKKEREWEQILGGSWLARVGVIALIIGAGFFLKYAFDNQWLGPVGRIVLGIIAGLVLIGLAFHWHNRYPILTRVLSGGGVAIMYLSIFASFSIYALVNVYVALGCLFVLSIASAAMAIYYNSMALAIISIFGAFFAPFILGAFGNREAIAVSLSSGIQLLAYIIVVDVGVLILANFRNWRWFTLLALVCSLITYGAWYAEFNDVISVGTAEAGITIIFLLFVGATSLHHLIRRLAPEPFDFGLMLLNAAAYFGISLGILWHNYREWMGGFVFVLALFYGVIAYIATRRQAGISRLGVLSIGIALVLLSVAIPIQLGDSAFTTIVWAAELVVLTQLSFTFHQPRLRHYGYLIFIAMVVRLLFFDTTVAISTLQPILNQRFLAFVVGIVVTYLVAYLLWRRRAESPGLTRPLAVLLISANFLTIWILSFEVWQSFDVALRGASPAAVEGLKDAQNLSLTAVWAVYALAGLITGIVKRWRYVRIGALGLLAISIVKVFVYDVFRLELGYRIGAFVGLGILLLVSAYLYQRYRDVIRGVLTNK